MLIHPHLNYGPAAWGQACETSPNKIVILQKKELLVMNFTDTREHAIRLFMDADILPWVSFMDYKTVASLMHDIYQKQQLICQQIWFIWKTSAIHSYHTRSSTSGIFYAKNWKLEIHVHTNSLSRFGVKT